MGAIQEISPRSYKEIVSYHAHIYFDTPQIEKARQLRTWVEERFLVELGRWNEGPFGPHTTPSYYFGFTIDLFPVVVPWLSLNRQGLTVLIHPNTDNPYEDHLVNGLWLGIPQAINAERLPHSLQALGQLPEQIHPNTRPTQTDF